MDQIVDWQRACWACLDSAKWKSKTYNKGETEQMGYRYKFTHTQAQTPEVIEMETANLDK